MSIQTFTNLVTKILKAGRNVNGTVTISTDTTDLDVTGVKTVFVDTSAADITFTGTINGVIGQPLNIIKIYSANNLIIVHNSGAATQRFYTATAANVTLTGYSSLSFSLLSVWYPNKG